MAAGAPQKPKEERPPGGPFFFLFLFFHIVYFPASSDRVLV